MGVEKHAAAFLLKLRADQVSLGRVLTLGHQSVYLDLEEYCRVLKRLNQPAVKCVPQFADDLLHAMGASQVEAMDASSYERAQLVHDLNRPVPIEWHQRYDTVFDGGTLEHVFDFPTAIRNCMEMLKPGGRFIAITVPNNWCGHGFYQFSPELFYRIFAQAQGFSLVEMYVAEAWRDRSYAVKDPAAVKSRIELCNNTPLFLMVHARRDAVRPIFAQAPQQSDYVAGWATPEEKGPLASPRPCEILRFKFLEKFRRNLRLRRYFRRCSLSNREFYTPVDLKI